MLIQKVKKLITINTAAGTFTSNVLKLITGTTIAQIIPIAISPVLTRIYSPEDFGIFVLYTAIVSMIAIVVTGRYELAVMLPEREEDAINIVALAIFIASLVTILTLMLVMIFNGLIMKKLSNSSISDLLYFVPISVLLTGIYQSFNYWSNRKQQYGRLAVSRVIQSIVTAIISLGLGFIGFGIQGLTLGLIGGQFVSTGVLVWQVWRADWYCKKSISKDRILKNAKVYKDFPRINLIHAFTDVLKTSGITFLVSAYFGNVVLGYFSITMRALRVPLGLIGTSVSQVFYQKAAEIHKRNADLRVVVKQILIRLTLISVPVFIIIAIFAPEGFKLIFGESWVEAGFYARILSPWILLNFIISPLSQVPLIMNKQKSAFYIGLLYNVTILSSFLLVSNITNDIFITLSSLSFFTSIILLYFIYWILKISCNKPYGGSR